MAFQFTDANFQQEVLSSKGLVLVDLYADWCGPCKMISPIIAELATAYEGKVKVGKLDVDSSQTVPGQYGIASIPTLLFFKDGQEVDRVVGFQPKDALEERIKKHL